MMFYLFAAIVGISCSAISLRTLVSYTEISTASKVLISLLVLAGWFAPLWTGAMRKYNLIPEGDLFSFIYTGGYCLFGLVFILFSVLIIRDISWYIAYGISKLSHFSIPNPKDAIVLYKANIWAFIISAILGLYAFYEGIKTPPFKEVEIADSKIKKDTTLVLITDLHMTRISRIERIRELVERINALNPDIIALGGDIIDDYVGLDEQLKELSKLKAQEGIFFVLGNHEVYRGWVGSEKKIESYGIKFLLNQGQQLKNNIYIAGIPDFGTSTYFPDLKVDIDNTLKNSGNDDYKIILSHSPKFIDTLKNGQIDLQLSGHTHGGQIFPFHIAVQKANHYLAGLYDTKNGKVYVSRGSGTWGPPMRLFAPSEVSVIKLKNK